MKDVEEGRVLYLRHGGDEVRGREYLVRFVLPSEAESVASEIHDLGIPIIFSDPSCATLR